MRIDLPILDKKQTIVAVLVWDGELYDGRWWFEPVETTQAQAQAIAGIVEINKHLRSVRFVSFGPKEHVSGWQGLEGVIGALRISLPAVGLNLGRFDPTDAKPDLIDFVSGPELSNEQRIE